MTSFVVSESLEAVSYCDIGKKGRGVTEDMVEVDFNVTKYKMKENEDTRKIIESKWQKKTAGNDRIFNATKFRIASHKWDSASGKLQLKIGITNYKDHVGTTLSPEMSQFEGQGDSRYELMAQCIAVGCWVVTSDHKIVLVKTAAWKGEQGCKIDRPGGHPEPDECLNDTNKNSEALNNVVKRELFESIQRELSDEINIGMDLQQEPELLGIVYNHAQSGRLAFDFLIQCKVDSEKVKELYKLGGSESDESTDLILVPLEAVTEERKNEELLKSATFTPHCTASMKLIKHRLKFPMQND